MIDHITLHSVGGLQNIEKLEDFHRGDTATGKAHIANMGVSCSLGGVILRGSLAKFHNGENCTDFARKDIETALIKLSAILGLDLLQAVVYSVEIGYSVIVKNSPSEYLRLFSDISKQRKVHSKNGVIETVSYGTRKGSYQFCAYDKAREMQKEGMEAPLLYEGENVLRLEYRITKRRGIQAQFHRDLLAQDLFTKETYKALNTLFLRFYKSLPKMGRTVIIDRSKSVTPSRWEALTGEAYRQTNPNAYNATLQSLNEQNQVLPKNLERIRARDRKRNKDFTISDTNPLIAELDALLEIAVIIDV